MSKKEEEYKEIFLGEALESYEHLNNLFTELEKNVNNKGAIDAIFRITHTLKGNAMGMGFQQIAELSHVMEDVFNNVKQGQLVLDDELFGSLFRANDKLGELIEALKTDAVVNYKGIKTKLEVLLHKVEANEGNGEKDVVEALKEHAPPVPQSSEVTPEEEIPAAENSEKALTLASDEAALLEDNRGGHNISVEGSVSGDQQEPAEEAPAQADPPETLATLVEEAQEEKEMDEKPAPVAEAATESVSQQKLGMSDLVQVPVRKLDNLLNIVGELIIEKDSIIARNAHLGERGNEFARLHRITSDLQYGVMDIRLVQVGFLFNKFHRVLRDAAKIENKKVNLILEGTDIEIDRNILKIMSDSLVHLVRNAVGHGIEPVEERLKAGKPAEGTVILKARNEKDTVFIEVSDDGYGMDVNRIKRKAIEKGIISEAYAKHISDDEVILSIFEPGFSSADKVTEVSGRGVGMDVVKRATESIGGKIEVDTELGKGSTVILSLPSSMAVKGALLFELDSQEFAIALAYTEAVISLKKKDIHKVNNGLVSTYLGSTISVVFLKDLFSMTGLKGLAREGSFHHSYDELEDTTKLEVLIVSYNNKQMGLIVDKLLQQKEIVEKALFKPVDKIEVISGATILGNGNVCLVLDIARIINTLFREKMTQKTTQNN